MKRLFLVPALGLAAMMLAVPAGAQTNGWLDNGRSSYSEQRQSYYDAGRAAYDNGYREGIKQGEKDGRKGQRFDFRDEKTFQRADKGYHREFGDLDRYRQSFRTGYSTGYGDAFQRFGPAYGSGSNGRAVPRRDTRGPVTYPNTYPSYPNQYPGTGGYRDAAFQNGVDDGYTKGVEDARKNRSFDPLRHEWYRSGDRRYEGRFGSREQYKDIYRQGFKDGYDRGYREGRYR
jgi:hypothetical protein